MPCSCKTQSRLIIGGWDRRTRRQGGESPNSSLYLRWCQRTDRRHLLLAKDICGPLWRDHPVYQPSALPFGHGQRVGCVDYLHANLLQRFGHLPPPYGLTCPKDTVEDRL